MEYYQTCQNRAQQTIAVINLYLPGLTVGGINTAALSSLCLNLDTLAQTRDNVVAVSDTARNTENLAWQALRKLTLTLPRSIEGELDEDIPTEQKLADLLDPVYAITPRTTELTLERARKLTAVLQQVNTYLSNLVPPRPAVTAAGKGAVDLLTAINNMPVVEQALENTAAAALESRTDLRNASRAVDRINKRFFKKLLAEARENPDLAAALPQIETDSADLPETLSIRTLLQGGPDLLHLLVTYEPGTGSDATTLALEWRIDGVDDNWNHTTPADHSGTQIGPYLPGQVIRVRTRTTNANGTRTSAPRQLTITAPA